MARSKTEKTGNERPKLSKAQLRRSLRIFSYILPFKWYFIASMIVLAVGSLLFLVIMQLPGEALDTVQGKGSYGMTLNQIFSLLAILLVAQAALSFFRVRLQAIVSEKSMAALREDLFQKVLSLPLGFFEQRRSGELISRITSDVTQLQSVFSITLVEFIRQIIIFIGGTIYILFTVFKLALVSLATFPLVIVMALFFGRYVRKLTKERQDQLAQSNVVVEESFQNIMAVKAYTSEEFESRRYGRSIQETVRISLKTATVRGLFAAFLITIMFGTLFFIIYRAMIQVQNGELDAGELLNFVVFTGIIGAAIASLGSFYTEIVAALGASDRIVDILENPDSESSFASMVQEEQSVVKLKQYNQAETQKAGSSIPNLKNAAIRFEDVHFAYPTRPDLPVLKGIDMEIKAGQQVALVGSSGSGKSTIVKLLLRFYEFEQGTIAVDGEDIRQFPLRSWRDQLALVPQEVLLFGGSIRENIAYGQPDLSEEAIREAARQANALEFIDAFPDGLDTLVGDRGIKLSGGQRQRIAIARAILKDPQVLLLDEATSSLDAESERLVQDALNKLMAGRTSIVIAHRLSTIREADRIYVLENGAIVETGTHEELANKADGTYNMLAKLQFENADA
ncbi:MAG: ABC transporter transmembrane domain-containing protein [Bacteroidota bacterium]